MDQYDNITNVLVTVITVLFSAGAWRFYERRIKLQTELDTLERTDQNMYRDDLRDRVKRLEKLLKIEFIDTIILCKNDYEFVIPILSLVINNGRDIVPFEVII